MRAHQAESAAEREEELAAARQKASDLEHQLAASQREAEERERLVKALDEQVTGSFDLLRCIHRVSLCSRLISLK